MMKPNRRPAGQDGSLVNIHILGIPEGIESKQRIKNLFEVIMTRDFFNLVKEKDTQFQKAQKVPTRWTQRGPL